MFLGHFGVALAAKKAVPAVSLGTLLAVYAANLLGPPPPSVDAIAWTCISMWLLVAWAGWVDRHREAA